MAAATPTPCIRTLTRKKKQSEVEAEEEATARFTCPSSSIKLLQFCIRGIRVWHACIIHNRVS